MCDTPNEDGTYAAFFAHGNVIYQDRLSFDEPPSSDPPAFSSFAAVTLISGFIPVRLVMTPGCEYLYALFRHTFIMPIAFRFDFDVDREYLEESAGATFANTDEFMRTITYSPWNYAWPVALFSDSATGEYPQTVKIMRPDSPASEYETIAEGLRGVQVHGAFTTRGTPRSSPRPADRF